MGRKLTVTYGQKESLTVNCQTRALTSVMLKELSKAPILS